MIDVLETVQLARRRAQDLEAAAYDNDADKLAEAWAHVGNVLYDAEDAIVSARKIGIGL